MKVRYTFFKFQTGSDSIVRKIPYMEIDSRIDGPVVYITACVHGDEVGGVAVLQDLFRSLRLSGLKKGKICSFPLMNPFSFEFAVRSLPHSGEDLNRRFPGKVDGSFGERLANQIFKKICETKPDLVIDLHNDWIRSIPYAVLDPKSEIFDSGVWQKAYEAVKQTGLLILQDSKPLFGTLTTSLLQNNIPAVTLELGESYVVNENFLKIGMQSIMNILSNLGMTEEFTKKPLLPSSQQFFLPDYIYNYFESPLASTSGIIRSNRKPGQKVREGEFLGQVVNTFGRSLERFKSLKPGIILGINDTFVSYPGKPIFAFATKD